MDWTPISFRLGNAPDSITPLDQANQTGLKQVESKVELRRYMTQRQQEQSGKDQCEARMKGDETQDRPITGGPKRKRQNKTKET